MNTQSDMQFADVQTAMPMLYVCLKGALLDVCKGGSKRFDVLFEREA